MSAVRAHSWIRRAASTTLGLSLVVAAAACTAKTKDTATNGSTSAGAPSSSASGTATGHIKQGGTVTIANEQGQTWTCRFNPYNPAVNVESLGFVYEPLVFVDILNNQAETPMLATSYKWNAAKTSITFTIRKNVKWNDGVPFTAKDVAFTFNTMKRVPATDLYSLWSGAGLQSVTPSGDTVTMRFGKTATTYFYNFADQVGIVPEHIFGKGAAAAHPDTWPDT